MLVRSFIKTLYSILELLKIVYHRVLEGRLKPPPPTTHTNLLWATQKNQHIFVVLCYSWLSFEAASTNNKTAIFVIRVHVFLLLILRTMFLYRIMEQKLARSALPNASNPEVCLVFYQTSMQELFGKEITSSIC